MNIKKFVKKPIIVEAIQYNGGNSEDIIKFTKGKASMNSTLPILSIETLEGYMEVGEGDFVIKGVEGEFYPCKYNIFRKTYNEVIK